MLLCQFESLESGVFSSRYKRFFVDVVRNDGSVEVVHCANTGSMKSCLLPEANVFTSRSKNPNRKLQSSLELMELPDGLACLNTARANDVMGALFQNFFENKDLFSRNAFQGLDLFESDFGGFTQCDREAKYTKETRFDFGLSNGAGQNTGWLEIKSVSLRLSEDVLAFPDAVTTRGQKHIEELTQLAIQGSRAFLLFVVMRASNLEARTVARSFRAAHEIDSRYAALLSQAVEAGVQVRVVVPSIAASGIGIRGYFKFNQEENS